METNTALREKVQQLRKAGLSLRATAEACGISKIRVHQFEHPYNPKGATKRYECKRCGLVWKSARRTKPDRCPSKKGCGSYYWEREDAGTSRTPGPKPAASKKRRASTDPA